MTAVGMSDRSGHKCALCDAPGKWFCAFCHSNCYCDSHACNHIARAYPEQFGINPKPGQASKQDSRRALGLDGRPDILIIPKEPDSGTGRPVPPLWMMYTRRART